MNSKNQIAAPAAANLPAQPQTTADQLLTLAVDKNLDMDKLERLMQMKEREEEKTAYAAFVVALSNFQAKCPRIKKTGTVTDKHNITLYTYPKYDVILETIQPHLKRNKLSVRFSGSVHDNKVNVTCLLSHVGGHTDETHFECDIEGHMAGGANKAQRTASANSFAKRYALMNALNLAGEEDDDAASLGSTELIGDKDLIKVRDHLAGLGSPKEDEQALCEFLEIDSLEEMPLAMLGKAMKAINEQKAAQ